MKEQGESADWLASSRAFDYSTHMEKERDSQVLPFNTDAYSADKSSMEHEKEQKPDQVTNQVTNKITSGRSDLQIMRRLFHFSCGSVTAVLYWLFVSHQQAVYILGAAASMLYISEQVRINYPNLTKKLDWFFYCMEYELFFAT